MKSRSKRGMKSLTNIEADNPDRDITRGELVQMMYNYKKYNE